MSKGFIFWVLMLLWLVLGILVPHWGAFTWAASGSVLEWILLALLGWQVFGGAIK